MFVMRFRWLLQRNGAGSARLTRMCLGDHDAGLRDRLRLARRQREMNDKFHKHDDKVSFSSTAVPVTIARRRANVFQVRQFLQLVLASGAMGLHR